VILNTLGIELYKAHEEILFIDVAGDKNPVYDMPGFIKDRRLIDYIVEFVVS
jgi:hypothetical protein